MTTAIAIHTELALPVRANLERAVARQLEALKLSSVEQLIRLSTSARSQRKRRSQAIYLLGLLSDLDKLCGQERRIVRILLKVMKENIPIISWSAALSLARIGDRSSVNKLIEVVKTTKREATRRAAIHALGLFGDKRAERALSEVLGNVSEPSGLRGEAAEAISSLASIRKRTHSILLRGLEDDSAEVRFFCAFTLGIVGHDDDKSPLRPLLRDKATVKSFGSVAKEARSAIRCITRRVKQGKQGDRRDVFQEGVNKTV